MAAAALCMLFIQPVFAQDAATFDSRAAQVESGLTGSEIIVTGAARAQRRFDASYAINTLGTIWRMASPSAMRPPRSATGRD